MKNNKNADTHYRRGIVLGLTFAELLMLLLFVVMLALGGTLKKWQDDKKIKSHSENELTAMVKLTSIIKRNNEQSYAKAIKLINSGEEDKAYQQLLENSKLIKDEKKENESKNFTKLAFLLKKMNAKAYTEAIKLINQGEEEKAYQKLFESSKPTKSALQFTHDELASAINFFEFLNRKNSEIYNEFRDYLTSGKIEDAYKLIVENSPQLKNISDEIKLQKNIINDCKTYNKHLVQINGGKGVELPACWRDQNDSTLQYIYHIELTDDGIIVSDNKIPAREAEKRKLPLDDFKIGVLMQPHEFIKAGQKLKKICDDNSCRHFVKIIDNTSPSSKEQYKKLKSSVENIFYKKDVQ